MDDLLAEYAAAIAAVSPGDIEHLEGLGVAPEFASGLLPDFPVLGKARVTVSDDGCYCPDPDGVMFYLSPVASGLELIDLAAWRPSEPDLIWMRTGCGVVLNPDAADTACWNQEPLYICTNVLEWLRWRCRGAVILQWDSGTPLYLPYSAPLWCQTEELAARVAELYQTGNPQILFFESERAAA